MDVKVSKLMNLGELIIKTEIACKELLGMNCCPPLQVKEMKNNKVFEVNDDLTLEPSTFYVMSLSTVPEDDVSFIVVNLPNSIHNQLDLGSGAWACIHIQEKKSPVQFAIAASLAQVIATECQSSIYDERKVWVNQTVTSPEEFKNLLSVKEKCNNSKKSLKIFYDQLAGVPIDVE
ncbi:hypothetical protein [Hazenella coriacea]|uniref:hypothetical protein n=1 Tax=Hazenella coriacea TaxID=1179467 RepID=UPI001A9CC103|nr:hypothetical protein [Hazenella coriacea]